MICFSEHGNTEVDEDSFGRLSMWRAYGGDNNVAMILNPEPFFAETNTFHAFTTPVLYADTASFLDQFESFVKGLEQREDYLIRLGHEQVFGLLFFAFHMAVLSTKHPAFFEEREWRIIYSPTIYKSDRIEQSIEVVAGEPQLVQKIPLLDVPETGLVGITIPSLLERVIIGPSQNPIPISDAFAAQMELLNIDDPVSKIKISNIPLRR
jgi:hypothetical protein